MARIFPFRALRYNPSMVRVEEVVTQPYDKISPAMQQAYYQRSIYNLVRIILGLPELFDEPGSNDVYSRAARDFADWRHMGILAQEKDPCVFAYSQRFSVPGSDGEVQERRAFIALGELCDYGQHVVFRHEQTLSKPKSDRLNLLRATRAHFGQIFMLYSDPGLTAEKILFSGATAPEIEVTDEYGVTHRVWKVSDMSTINILLGAMEDKKLIIADGHHRYETALAYSLEHTPRTVARTERNLANTIPQPGFPEAAVMMTFVNMDSGGIVILPTHRVVFGLTDFAPAAFLERAKQFFDIRLVTAEDPVALTRLLARQPGTAFIAVTSLGYHLLTAKPEAVTPSAGQGPRTATPPGSDPAALPHPGATAGHHTGSDSGATQPALRARCGRGHGTGLPRGGRRGLPDQSHHLGPVARSRLCRRCHAAEIHRFLSQITQRPCHLCAGLRPWLLLWRLFLPAPRPFQRHRLLPQWLTRCALR